MRNFLLSACMIIASSACTTPYRPPVAQESDATVAGAFPGIADLLSVERPTRVFWTHGMCTHDMKWVENTDKAFARALDAALEPPVAAAHLPNTHYVEPRKFKTPKGEIDVSYFVWSPLTAGLKHGLDYDSDSQATRASFDRKLKRQLINDCFADAIIYSGPAGDPIRQAALNEVCAVLGGQMTGGFCRLVATAPASPLVFVAESLGSKVLFDALSTIRDQHRTPQARQAFAQRVGAVRIIFMLANQLPLLRLAKPDQELREVFSLGSERPVLVAFSDPSDLLSYELRGQDLQASGVRLVNVRVSNDSTYFGLVERPDTAHCGYNWNAYVLGMIMRGYQPHRAFAQIDVPQQGSCLQ